MNFRERPNNGVRDGRAVSPVIGTVLMVGITVILASVIGAFVLGTGGSAAQSTPNAQFGYDFDADEGTVVITHEGGESIDADRVQITGLDSGEGDDGTVQGTDAWADDTLVAGSTTTALEYEPDSNVRVVWISEGGDRSTTLANQRAPS